MSEIQSRDAAPKTPKKSLRRRLITLSILLGFPLICLVVLYCLRKPILVEAAHLLVVDDQPVQSDYIVIPGGDPNSRPFLAANLYKKGIAPKILIFETKSDRLVELGMALTEDQVYQRVLEHEGVPASAIERLPGVVDSTENEAASLQRFLSAHSVDRVIRIIIPTSAEHTRRTRWIFRKTLSGKSVEIRMSAARNPLYDETNWWREDSGAMAIAHEYMKWPFYLYRYSW